MLRSWIFVLAAIWVFSPNSFGAWPRHVIDSHSRGADGVRLADINGDGRPDVATGWEQGGVVRVCFHPAPERSKQPWPAVTVGAAPDVEDAVFADLDGDGQFDVISCSEGKTRRMAVHWGPSDRGRQQDPAAWRTEPFTPSVERMLWMFAMPLDIDGRHGIDLVAGGKGNRAALGWFASPPQPRKLDDWRWHELRPLGWLMSLVAVDMDGDGDQDILFSDRKGSRSGAYWLENPGADQAATTSWREHLIGAAGTEAMFLEVADLDQDGLDDVLLAVRPHELRWLRRLDRTGLHWNSHTIPLPKNAGGAKAVQAADLDQDGRLDLLFSCEGAKPPLHGLMWLSAAGSPDSEMWTPHELSGPDGIKHDLLAVLDLDDDGDLDVMTTEENKNFGVIWYENPLR